jgi:hypothetical protein
MSHRNPIEPGDKVFKSTPANVQLAGREELSIWGDKMAVVEAPYWDATGPEDYDPATHSIRYLVFVSDIPANPKLVGVGVSWKYGNKSLYDQPFYFRPFRGAMGSERGQLAEPFSAWIAIPFKDLSPQQTGVTTRWLESQGYAENDRYPLSQAKLKKLFKATTFSATQDLDPELANAADAMVIRAAGKSMRGYVEDEEAERVWAALPGVFQTTKKGVIKFVMDKSGAKHNPPYSGYDPHYPEKKGPKDPTKISYRTKRDALNVFIDWNISAIDEAFSGPNAKQPYDSFDNINHRYGLKGKRRVDTFAKALWWAMPSGSPYYLEDIDVNMLNETSPMRHNTTRTLMLPDYAEERRLLEQEIASLEERYGYELEPMLGEYEYVSEDAFANPVTGPSIGPRGRGHLHEFECPTKIPLDGLTAKGERGHPKPNPHNASKAIDKFEEFHDLPPKHIEHSKMNLPSRVHLLGEASSVLYRSDKWGDKGINYIHDHDPGVKVGSPKGNGRTIPIPAKFRNAKTLAKLGDCLEFTFENKDGEEVAAKASRPYPELYSTPDGKCLFVIQDKKTCLAVIWGGNLDVKDVGIVG